MDGLQTKFYDNLETSKRAIANWKKLHNILVMIKVCGGKLTLKDRELLKKEENKIETSTIKAFLARNSFTPTSIYKVTWDLVMGFVYLICYFIDPFCVAFYYKPLYDTNLNRLQRIFTFILIFNMILVPITARAKKFELFSTTEDEPAIGVSMSFQKK